MIIKGKVTTVWDANSGGNGNAIESDCEVNIETGSVAVAMAGTPVTGGGLYLGRQFVTINGIEFAVSFDAKIIKLAAFRKAVLTPVRPEGVFTFLDCSSVHLTKATLMMLSNGDHLRYPSTVAPYAYGVLVGVPNYEEPDEPMDGFPPDV
jgi:hypothetical protein